MMQFTYFLGAGETIMQRAAFCFTDEISTFKVCLELLTTCKMKEDKRTITRRSFVGTTGAAIAGLTILPSGVVSGLGHRAPSDKLNIAGIGIGGVGATNIRNVASSENIVALCDVDWGYSKGSLMRIPQQRSTGISGRCMMRWASLLMRSSLPPLTIPMHCQLLRQ